MKEHSKPVRKCHSCGLNLGDRCGVYPVPRSMWHHRTCPGHGNQAMLEAFEKVRAETLELLARLAEADLDKPSVNSPSQELFGTVGRCLATLVNHQTFHVGQIADARRALGRKPAFA